MKLINFHINEGLLKLPVKTSATIFNATMYAALTHLYETIKTQSIKQSIEKLQKQYFKPTNLQLHTLEDEFDYIIGSTEIEIPKDNLPEELQDKMPTDEDDDQKFHIFLVIIMSAKRDSSYDPDSKIMLINTHSLAKALFQTQSELSVKGAIKSIQTDIAHELTHVYQEAIRELDPNYSQLPQGYSDYGQEYFTSEIEFDPMIKSTVGFYHQLQAISTDKQSIKQLFNLIISGRYPGDILVGQLLAVGNPEVQQLIQFIKNYDKSIVLLANFFYHTKQKDPNKWKKAIKYLLNQL